MFIPNETDFSINSVINISDKFFPQTPQFIVPEDNIGDKTCQLCEKTNLGVVQPYGRYGKYFDICDDWEPTEEMLKLNDEALKNDITAIVGLGASPGISNLLGLKAMNELDEAESIITGWDVSSAKPEDESSQKGTNAAMEHGLQQISGEIKVYKDKKYKLTKPLGKIKIH